MSEAKAAIWTAHANVDNPKAMEALLAPLPPQIASAARDTPPGMDGMRYSEESRRAYWLVHNENTGILSCFTFEEIDSLERAAELWAEIKSSALITLDTVRRAYSRVTDLPLEEINAKH